MATLPTLGPRRTPNAGRAIDTGLTPVDLNTAVDTSAVGQAAANFGQTITNVGENMQKEQDASAIFAARRKLDDWERATIYDPQAGAISKKGADSFELPKRIPQEFDKAAGEIGKTLQGDRQRRAFEEMAVSRRASVSDWAARHATQQRQVYMEGQYNADIDSSLNRAAMLASAGDFATAKAETSLAQTRTTGYLRSLGKSEEEIAVAVRNVSSKANVVTINMLLEKDKPLEADKYLKDNAAGMNVEDLLRATSAVNKSVDARVGLVTATDIVKSAVVPAVQPTDTVRLKNLVEGSLPKPNKDEAAMRVNVALTPAEQARSDAFERSPANIAELKGEIARQKDPKARALLEEELAKQTSKPADFGNRADGSKKGNGFLGVLQRPDGGVSTEITVGVNINGKETDIPTLVPTLTKAEVDSLLKGDKPSDAIVQKAVDHAKSRIAAGKSVFADEGPAPVTLDNMLTQYAGDVSKAVAAMKVGPDTVDKAIKAASNGRGKTGDWMAFMPDETKAYVAKITTDYSKGAGAPAMPSLQQLEDQVRAKIGMDSPERYRTAVTEVKRQYGEMLAAKKQTEEQNTTAAYDWLVKNKGDYARMPPALLSNLPPGKVDDTMTFAGKIAAGVPIQTDWNTYTQLRAMAVSNPAKFAATDLRNYYPTIAPAQREQLVDLQTKVNDPKSQPQVVALASQLSIAHEQLGITKNDAKKGMFDNAVTQAINDAQTEQKRQLTFEERDKIIKRMQLPTTSGFFSADRVYEVTGTSKEAGAKIKMVDEDKKLITAALKAEGVPVTDAAIQARFNLRHGIK